MTVLLLPCWPLALARVWDMLMTRGDCEDEGPGVGGAAHFFFSTITAVDYMQILLGAVALLSAGR